jgi:DNA sulfur modification protein DndD
MLLTKVTLNDFGVYRGQNEFDFATTVQKPIILCGGSNGAGKTTLFDSVMLCFYGKDSFEQKISKKQYSDKILHSFHRVLGTKKTATQSSIIVEFEYAQEGKISTYQVERLWRNIEGEVEEEFTIKKKDSEDASFETLDSLEESEWQMFIHQLIPKGIARLFFFDGEKIQKIAEEGMEDEYIRLSFDTLLGLDIVNQLNVDLSYAVQRMQEDGNLKEAEMKLEAAKKEREKFEKEHERIQGQLEFAKENSDKRRRIYKARRAVL